MSTAADPRTPERLPDLLTVEEIVRKYHLSDRHVRSLIESGELVGFKLGNKLRVHPDDWAAFIDGRRAQP
jgi:excisionase family DNA binding protein